jgi:biopolymer transport protein ExbD
MNLRGRNKISPEFNMSSMTDIVFLLLIFFMIASTLAKQLDTIEVKLPQAKGKTENRQSIAVTINENNRFFIDGKIEIILAVDAN